MTARLGSLPDGARGFDANAPVTATAAQAAAAMGYTFAVRYVRRSSAHSYDVTAGEIATLLQHGLGVMLVQHVAAPGWSPNAALGQTYGTTAASEARAAGYPAGAHLWCDLEGVSIHAAASDVIAYCNAWYDAAAALGYLPGLYVGDSAGLTGAQLFKSLRFAAFWGAYNLNRDMEPTGRGLMMRQRAAHPAELIPGYSNQTMDVDVIAADGYRSTPIMVLP